MIHKSTVLTGTDFSISLYLDKYYRPTGEGYIECISCEGKVNWDNLSWFKDLSDEKIKEIKGELKEKGVYQKGMIKDLKKLLSEAKKNVKNVL